jgi:type III pantothenate kinase
MLLAVDVGNTQTVLGLYEGERLEQHYRIATEPHRTADELAALYRNLVDFGAVTGICLASTVPSLVPSYEELAERWIESELIVLGPGTRTGISIRFDDPREVGPDRIANAIAALERCGAPCIAVDFGTATNFDAISAEGEYIGGVLAPGIEISMEALFARAARLRQVDFAEPANVIGKSTASALQSGLVFGFAGQVDGIVERMQAELGGRAKTIATGGLASLIVPHCRTVEAIEEFLTLEGLRIVWQRNVESGRV